MKSFREVGIISYFYSGRSSTLDKWIQSFDVLLKELFKA